MTYTIRKLHKGFCSTLFTVVGGEDRFGETASGDDRWRTLLDSGSKLGQEVNEAWGALQREDQDAAAWLGEEVTGPLSVDVASAGGKCCSGETRGKITEHREMIMGRLIDEGLVIRNAGLCGAGRRGISFPASGCSPSQGMTPP